MDKQLLAISPIDGRYYEKTMELASFFSEYALIKYRIVVEIKYFIFLYNLGLKELSELTEDDIKNINSIHENFDIEEAEVVKEFEGRTNHDVKAVEYYIKFIMATFDLEKYSRFVHFGLTSQDINNTSLSLIVKDFIQYYNAKSFIIIEKLDNFRKLYRDIPMLSRTHGQPASPTLLGKEFAVFYERLYNQLIGLNNTLITTKFGGAVGNLNAHYVSYPNYNWAEEMDIFIHNLGMMRQQNTTQIEHYDNLAAIFDGFKRVNVILVDMCRDIWHYISLGYFTQKFKKGEVGSSTMPHKINPIDFENAEGNLLLANALFEFLSRKLPISRLQRDLTDSTVTRNIGVACSHTIIGFKSILRGLDKIVVNRTKINEDLEDNWVVISEAIQTILKREGINDGYELLKDFTRNNSKIGKEEIHKFIDELKVSDEVKEDLKTITPYNYTGYSHY